MYGLFFFKKIKVLLLNKPLMLCLMFEIDFYTHVEFLPCKVLFIYVFSRDGYFQVCKVLLISN